MYGPGMPNQDLPPDLQKQADDIKGKQPSVGLAPAATAPPAADVTTLTPQEAEIEAAVARDRLGRREAARIGKERQDRLSELADPNLMGPKLPKAEIDKRYEQQTQAEVQRRLDESKGLRDKRIEAERQADPRRHGTDRTLPGITLSEHDQRLVGQLGGERYNTLLKIIDGGMVPESLYSDPTSLRILQEIWPQIKGARRRRRQEEARERLRPDPAAVEAAQQKLTEQQRTRGQAASKLMGEGGPMGEEEAASIGKQLGGYYGSAQGLADMVGKTPFDALQSVLVANSGMTLEEAFESTDPDIQNAILVFDRARKSQKIEMAHQSRLADIEINKAKRELAQNRVYDMDRRRMELNEARGVGPGDPGYLPTSSERITQRERINSYFRDRRLGDRGRRNKLPPVGTAPKVPSGIISRSEAEHTTELPNGQIVREADGRHSMIVSVDGKRQAIPMHRDVYGNLRPDSSAIERFGYHQKLAQSPVLRKSMIGEITSDEFHPFHGDMRKTLEERSVLVANGGNDEMAAKREKIRAARGKGQLSSEQAGALYERLDEELDDLLKEHDKRISGLLWESDQSDLDYTSVMDEVRARLEKQREAKDDPTGGLAEQLTPEEMRRAVIEERRNLRSAFSLGPESGTETNPELDIAIGEVEDEAGGNFVTGLLPARGLLSRVSKSPVPFPIGPPLDVGAASDLGWEAYDHLKPGAEVIGQVVAGKITRAIGSAWQGVKGIWTGQEGSLPRQDVDPNAYQKSMDRHGGMGGPRPRKTNEWRNVVDTPIGANDAHQVDSYLIGLADYHPFGSKISPEDVHGIMGEIYQVLGGKVSERDVVAILGHTINTYGWEIDESADPMHGENYREDVMENSPGPPVKSTSDAVYYGETEDTPGGPVGHGIGMAVDKSGFKFFGQFASGQPFAGTLTDPGGRAVGEIVNGELVQA